jgi:hypothetical protein
MGNGKFAGRYDPAVLNSRKVVVVKLTPDLLQRRINFPTHNRTLSVLNDV